MHEYSLVQSLMERIEQEASARRAVAIHRVRVRIGELSGVEPDLFASAFDIVRERTICEHAELVLTRIAARWECPACQTTFAPGAALQCARCGAPARLAAGDDILLEQIEMEVP